MEIVAFVASVGKISLPFVQQEEEVLSKEYVDLLKNVSRAEIDKEITRCPHKETSEKMMEVGGDLHLWSLIRMLIGYEGDSGG